MNTPIPKIRSGTRSRTAKAAGEPALEPALKMYYAVTDSETPVWAKTTIYGALGYFISPIDVIPNVAPLIGYTDDVEGGGVDGYCVPYQKCACGEGQGDVVAVVFLKWLHDAVDVA